MKNFIVYILIICPFLVGAQTNINIDITDVKFNRPGNPTGYCLSYLSDLEYGSQATFQQAIINSKVGTLRFPMGTLGDNYLWQTPGNYGSSTLQHRVATKQVNPGSFPDVNTDGTFKAHVMDFDEFIAICQATSTEPVVMVNAQSYKMPGSIVNYNQLLTSAVEWVKYANVTKGYNVKYWEIGNEVDIHNGEYQTKEEYLALLIEFSQAMKAIDPTIKIGAGIYRDPTWMNYIVDNAAAHMDFIVPHQYTNVLANYGEYKESTGNFTPNIENAVNAISRPGGATSDRLEVVVTEYSGHSLHQAYDNDNNVHFKGLVTFELLANMLTLDKRVTKTHFWVSHNPWGDRTTITAADAFTSTNDFTPMTYAQTVVGQFIKPKILNVTKKQGYLRTYAAYNDVDNSMAVWVLNKNNATENVAINLGSHSFTEVDKWEFKATSPDALVSAWNKVSTNAVQGAVNASLKPYSVTVFEFKGGVGSANPSIGSTIQVKFAATDQYLYVENTSEKRCKGNGGGSSNWATFKVHDAGSPWIRLECQATPGKYLMADGNETAYPLRSVGGTGDWTKLKFVEVNGSMRIESFLSGQYVKVNLNQSNLVECNGGTGSWTSVSWQLNSSDTISQGTSTKVDNSETGVLSYSNQGTAAQSWTHISRSESYNSTISYTEQVDDVVELTFTGDFVKLFMQKGPGAGKFNISLDGSYITTIDGYSEGHQHQVNVYEKTWGSVGTHSIKVRCNYAKNGSASGYWVNFDYIEYGESGTTSGRLAKSEKVNVLPSKEGLSPGISLYPNPSATGRVFVDLAGYEGQQVNIEAIGPGGRIVYTESKAVKDDHQQIEINLSGLAKGMYGISVTGEQEMKYLKLLLE